MKNKLLYQQHIMWYESKMINETLDSLQQAVSVSNIDVDLKFCLNSQTYLETPIQGNPEDMFDEFINHPILKNSEIIYKTDSDPFYNIGDWRRKIYDSEYKYTIWGESDCLIPIDYFYILSNLKIDESHYITLASRKMWDNTWKIVEHSDIRKYLNTKDTPYTAPFPLNSSNVISQLELDSYNSKFPIEIVKLNTNKIDGSLVALSSNLPTPFIPTDMHFAKEDSCAEAVFKIKKIPQYLIRTRIKGHNYGHPFKRTNTNNTRNDDIYTKYQSESANSMINFLKNIR